MTRRREEEEKKKKKKNEKKKEQRTKERRNKFSAFLCVRGTIVESRDPGYMRSLQKGSVMRERGKKERETDRQAGRQRQTERKWRNKRR
jgi:hypothetical protein